MDDEQDLRPRYASALKPPVVLAGLAGLAVFVWWAIAPVPGLPLPDGALRNEECGFAVMPLPEWRIRKNESGPALSNCGQGGVGSGRAEVEAFEMTRELAYGVEAKFTVGVDPNPLPALSEEVGSAWLRGFEKGLGDGGNSVRTETSEIITVDGLASFRASGAWKLPGEEVRFMAALVPGRGRCYSVLFMAPGNEFASLRASFERALKNFRVVSRPSRLQLATGISL